MRSYKDIWYQSPDGLKLYARDYSATGQTAPVILCMHGLSRNSADFEALAEQLAQDYRVISVDQRGRGLSQWDADAQRYTPSVYNRDMWQLLDQLAIERVIIIGTSMGGLMGMMMAAEQPLRVVGLVINDVGPEVAPEGLQRIMSYVGKGKRVETWQDAIDQTRFLNAACFPSYREAQWQRMARRLYRENDQGVPVLAYDPAISSPIESDSSSLVPPDLWSLFGVLTSIPVLAIRGALSDILSESTFQRMQDLLPNLQALEVPGVGHAPVLDEVEALQGIKQFIGALAD